jgi:hypothetical protein
MAHLSAVRISSSENAAFSAPLERFEKPSAILASILYLVRLGYQKAKLL